MIAVARETVAFVGASRPMVSLLSTGLQRAGKAEVASFCFVCGFRLRMFVFVRNHARVRGNKLHDTTQASSNTSLADGPR